MSFETRTTHDLMQIAACSGGFRLDAAVRTTLDLSRIAQAAAGTGARLTFSGMAVRTTHDLMQIASAGKGCVTFED